MRTIFGGDIGGSDDWPMRRMGQAYGAGLPQGPVGTSRTAPGSLIACPNVNGTFTLRDASTGILVSPSAGPPLPAGTAVVEAGDPRCVPAPAPAEGASVPVVPLVATVAIGALVTALLA